MPFYIYLFCLFCGLLCWCAYHPFFPDIGRKDTSGLGNFFCSPLAGRTGNVPVGCHIDIKDIGQSISGSLIYFAFPGATCCPVLSSPFIKLERISTHEAWPFCHLAWEDQQKWSFSTAWFLIRSCSWSHDIHRCQPWWLSWKSIKWYLEKRLQTNYWGHDTHYITGRQVHKAPVLYFISSWPVSDTIVKCYGPNLPGPILQI